MGELHETLAPPNGRVPSRTFPTIPVRTHSPYTITLPRSHLRRPGTSMSGPSCKEENSHARAPPNTQCPATFEYNGAHAFLRARTRTQVFVHSPHAKPCPARIHHRSGRSMSESSGREKRRFSREERIRRYVLIRCLCESSCFSHSWDPSRGVERRLANDKCPLRVNMHLFLSLG